MRWMWQATSKFIAWCKNKNLPHQRQHPPPAIAETPTQKQRWSSYSNVNANVCDTPLTTTLIVPVNLKHKDKQEVLLKVYAMLDDGSDSTFVTESTLNKLGVAGPEISLKLNTMHGEKLVSTQKVKRLMVQSLDERTTIELPKTYKRPFHWAHTKSPSPKLPINGLIWENYATKYQKLTRTLKLDF